MVEQRAERARPYSEKVQTLVPEGSSSSLHQVDDDGALSHAKMFMQARIFVVFNQGIGIRIRIGS